MARALLKEAPILLLDEPTEGMDSETEYALLKAVFESRPDCTIMLITHRPAAIEMMDKIVFIERGRIVGQEKPDTVLRQDHDKPAQTDFVDVILNQR